jgi:chromosome segregation ATPase
MGGFTMDFCRKLERERDEAREALKHIAEYGTEEINAAVDLRKKLATALVERDEARRDLDNMQDQRDLALKVIKRLERERDKAREQRDSFQALSQSLAETCAKLKTERDAARKDLELRCDLYKVQEELLDVTRRQRDEARTALPAGEWVAYADHQKVHNAASRLLVAINKQLPIGSFSLISHEYHAVKDAIYGREGAQ